MRVYVSKLEFRKFKVASDNLAWGERLYYAGYVEDAAKYCEALMLELDSMGIFYTVTGKQSEFN